MASSRPAVKSPQAFRTISEASEAVGAPQHVLRFWETKFPFVTPVKRAGGRRFYRPQDIVLLKAVRRLLHEEGLTIKGVQRLHKDQGLARIAAFGDPEGAFGLETVAVPPPRSTPKVTSSQGDDTGPGPGVLHQVVADLKAAKARLDAVLAG